MRVQFPENVKQFIEKWSGEIDMLSAADFIPSEKFDIFNVPFELDYGGAGRGQV